MAAFSDSRPEYFVVSSMGDQVYADSEMLPRIIESLRGKGREVAVYHLVRAWDLVRYHGVPYESVLGEEDR